MHIALRDINKKGVEIGERQNRCHDNIQYDQSSEQGTRDQLGCVSAFLCITHD